ncbi:MAG: hypothetical protein AVDCRST_MAG77-2718, partial [uncultured Chloroflexi bacterium]
ARRARSTSWTERASHSRASSTGPAASSPFTTRGCTSSPLVIPSTGTRGVRDSKKKIVLARN